VSTCSDDNAAGLVDVGAPRLSESSVRAGKVNANESRDGRDTELKNGKVRLFEERLGCCCQ